MAISTTAVQVFTEMKRQFTGRPNEQVAQLK